MKLIRDWFGMPPSSGARSEAENQTIREITRRLDELPLEQARYVAAFAYILGRVAHADLDISQEETLSMEEIVVRHGGLTTDLAIVVVQMAKSQNVLFGGTENYLVTREFKKLSTPEQRRHLLHCLFAVSSSDESISLVEDNEIRQVSKELGITHSEFISIRSDFRDYLAVLKKPRPGND
jgi:uncharacterized tellurite resistance protein B-like protein